MTFSVVGRDLATGDLGVAAQSKFLAIGATSIAAAAELAAVATQGLINVSYGPRALRLVADGATAGAALASLVLTDALAPRRQAAIIDAHGRVAVHTGTKCAPLAGHVTGDGFSCQGNMLAPGAVLDQMAAAMACGSDQALPERLLSALLAGQTAGGDARGQQSAALLVVRAHGGYGGFNDRLVDLHVDDHIAPIRELQRLLGQHRLHFDKPREQELLPLAPLTEEIVARLGRLGFMPAVDDGDAVWDALERWAGRENLEARMTRRGTVDLTLLAQLRKSDPSHRSNKDE